MRNNKNTWEIKESAFNICIAHIFKKENDERTTYKKYSLNKEKGREKMEAHTGEIKDLMSQNWHFPFKLSIINFYLISFILYLYILSSIQGEYQSSRTQKMIDYLIIFICFIPHHNVHTHTHLIIKPTLSIPLTIAENGYLFCIC